MDRKLLDKYFRDQCSEEELEQVLNWFQTEEGQAFLEKDIERQSQRFMENSDMFLYPEIQSEKIFSRIQLHKNRGLKRGYWVYIRVASILMLVGILSGLLYWGGITSRHPSPKSTVATYVTKSDQQKVFSLSDGTKIRLNEGSTLTVPRKFSDNSRKVQLRGEAYFEVAHDPAHPFLVNAIGSTIEVLGTKFNVKTDSVAKSVQVAVVAGKVALRKEGKKHVASALLTRNHLGVLHLPNSEITIEKGEVQNYLSWINNRLVFKGASMGKVSRQLERIYGAHIQFENRRLKKLNLTADFERTNLKKVLKIISHSLDIHFKINKNNVIWTK